MTAQAKAQTTTQRRPSLKVKVICWVSYWIYRALTCTYRVTYIDEHYVATAKDLHPAKSFIYGIWHEVFFSAVATHPFQNVRPMISQSNDGEIISYIAGRLGFDPVRGSTSRGGEEAREELYKLIDAGLKAAFTADGPRGPRRKMKSGLIDLSRRGGMAILPLSIDADRKWILHKSWDKSLIPKPFARVFVVYGPPTIVATDAHGLAFARAKKDIADRINACVKRAQQLAEG